MVESSQAAGASCGERSQFMCVSVFLAAWPCFELAYLVRRVGPGITEVEVEIQALASGFGPF